MVNSQNAACMLSDGVNLHRFRFDAVESDCVSVRFRFNDSSSPSSSSFDNTSGFTSFATQYVHNVNSTL